MAIFHDPELLSLQWILQLPLPPLVFLYSRDLKVTRKNQGLDSFDYQSSQSSIPSLGHKHHD